MENWSKVIADIEEADMVLVGIGEEFQEIKYLKQTDEKYDEIIEVLEQNQLAHTIPAFQDFLRTAHDTKAEKALNKLCDLLKNKNYFIVSTATNSCIQNISWKRNQIVMPCGSILKKQCPECVEGKVSEIAPLEQEKMKEGFFEIHKNEIGSANMQEGIEILKSGLGCCPNCQKNYQYNTVFCDNYNENGYLDQWLFYTKWLQGSINRKLVILELGVLMQFPTVIRFPFEKVAYFNQKAKLYRINGSLFQMTEELKGKGISISENAIDWLENLC